MTRIPLVEYWAMSESQRQTLAEMRRLASEFCASHGISTPKVKCGDRCVQGVFRTTGNHYFNVYHEGVIVVDMSASWSKPKQLESFFHELIHQWQKLALGEQAWEKWYRAGATNSRVGKIRRLANLIRRKGREDQSFEDYLASPAEVEARSFSRSITE